MSTFRIGIVGDLHTHWDALDVELFNRSDYDLLYFTGDLGGGTRESSLRIARALSGLRKPTLVMPGNNDTVDIAELAAELAHRGALGLLGAIRRGDPEAQARKDAAVQLCGYGLHRIRCGAHDFTLVAARPHSMGGPELSFAPYMHAAYGIASLEDSTRRLLALVDAAETERLIFVAHNGPAGLGAASRDIWGCDFRPGAGDWGDPDLAAAIAHARVRGRRVLAVVAGHMHLRTRCGGERPWCLERDGVLYVNAARVPRIFDSGGGLRRHHVALSVDASGIAVEEVFVDA